jgi:CRP-like cAMP-binding protein
MLTPTQMRDAVALLPFLSNSNARLVRAFSAQTTLMHLPAGTTIFEAGDRCSTFAILTTGQVRVFTIGETGREITLYRFEHGESCILTTSCILSTQQLPAIATVEQDVSAYVIPDTVDRTVRVLVAVVIAALIVMGQIRGILAIVLGILAGVFVLTSVVGFCPLYAPFGLRTCAK